MRDDAIDCENQTSNVVLREAIWNHFSDDLQLKGIEIDAAKEDAKKIWDKLSSYLPMYSLFQSDRENSDGDSEIIVKELEYSNLRLVSEVNCQKQVLTVEPGVLQYPSLNEVNFTAFGEVAAEYHNELYGFLDLQGWL